MCKDCGCETQNQAHNSNLGRVPRDHQHGPVAGAHRHDTTPHDHDHDHGHDHPHLHGGAQAGGRAEGTDAPVARVLEVELNVLAANDRDAQANRLWLAERRVVTLNLISSPGSGKTFLLEKSLEALRGRIACAVITGDQQTDNDARRLAGKGAPVRQIETHSSCHLNAAMIRDVLPDVLTPETRLLFIENVGNLVCPAAFDLGESFKVAMLSATEGEDKPVKYPALFSMAQVVVLSKMDLSPHLEWDRQRCRGYIRQVHPGVVVFELSAKSGQGMDAWIRYLESLVT